MLESVPFTIPDVMEGLAEVEGRMRYEEGVLSLDLSLKDGLIGIAWERKEVPLNLADIEAVELKQKWRKFHLTLTPRRMTVFKDIPGLKQGSANLRIALKHRKALMLIIDEISAWDGPEALAMTDETQTKD